MAQNQLAVQSRPERGESSNQAQSRTLITGLPNDIALLILIRVPRAQHGRCRLVSKAWRAEVGSADFRAKRAELGLCEDWPYMILSGAPKWHKLDPILTRWHSVPDMPADYAFTNGDRECFGAGLKLMVVGLHVNEETRRIEPLIWSLDISTSEWSVAPPMQTRRCLFASATMGNVAFVAGGSEYDGRRGLTSAECFDSLADRWQNIADMNRPRKECSGFIMDGCFCVIGGISPNRAPLTSGEIYDPASDSWRLVPDMWPGWIHTPSPHPSPPLVAVVDNQLYALDAFNNELKKYNKQDNTWSILCGLPFVNPRSTGWGLGFKAVEGELWVIGGSNPAGGALIDACLVNPVTDAVSWRRVIEIRGNGFCYNCAVIRVPCAFTDQSNASFVPM